MEVILDTALHRINIQKEIVESALKSRRANFEIKQVEIFMTTLARSLNDLSMVASGI